MPVMSFPVQVTGVTSDSRQVQPGNAFVAISGRQTDGNLFVSEAIARGAAVVYSEKDHYGFPVPLVKVKDSRKTLAGLAAAYYDHPSRKMKVVGLTGTNGKTTTAQILFWLLEQGDTKTGLIGTLGSWCGDRCYPPGLTTPEPVALQSMLAEMVNAGCRACVMEVSSQGMKQKRVDNISFDSAAITNISLDHSDLHHTWDDYLEAKAMLLARVPKGHLVFFNADDSWAEQAATGANGFLVGFGICNGSVRGEKINASAAGTCFYFSLKRFLPCSGGGLLKPFSFPIYTPIVGLHNVYNLLPAVALALHYGVAPESIQSSLEKFPGVWRRQQVIQRQPFMIIDDCSHNPGNYRSLFKTLSLFEYRRLLLLVAVRGNRGMEINMENGRVIAGFLRCHPAEVWVTDCNGTVKPEDSVYPEERQALIKQLQQGMGKLHFQEDLRDSLKEILREAQPGDLVVLAGAHPMDGAAAVVRDILAPVILSKN